MSIFESHKFMGKKPLTLERLLTSIFDKLQKSLSPHIFINNQNEYLYIGLPAKNTSNGHGSPMQELKNWPEELIEKLHFNKDNTSLNYSSTSLTMKMGDKVIFNMDIGGKNKTSEQESKEKLLRALDRMKIRN